MNTVSHSPTTVAGSVLVCAAAPEAGERLCGMIASLGHRTSAVAGFDALFGEVRTGKFDCCVIDDGHLLDGETAARLREASQQVQCLLLFDQEALTARETVPAVAAEILEKPVSAARFNAALTSAIARARLAAENRRLRARLSQQISSGLVGLGPAIVAFRERLYELAEGDQPVLICGEAGTEIMAAARAVHAASRRAHRPFAKIDCGLLTSEILERELFGAADADDVGGSGRLDWAQGGTLLLDNVDKAPQRMHARLGQVIAAAANEGQRGEKDDVQGVRLIVAIQQCSGRSAEEERFVQSLAVSLGATSASIPPLRQRCEDLGLLAEALLDQFAASSGRPAKRLSLNALNLLKEYHWPENVTELQRVLQQASACDSETRITAELIRPWLATHTETDGDSLPWLSLREMERRLIETTFARCGGNRERTAKALKIGLRTLSGKLREYGYPPRGGPGSNREESHDRAA